METTAKILCDSISPAGFRLTTFEAIYPRIVLAEVNTHRQLGRNSASSRAIPIERMIKRVLDDGYVPTHWGKNQKGMQAEQDVDGVTAVQAAIVWRSAMLSAVDFVERLLKLGIHKQITNRLIEPFMWHPTVISATEWSNFFNLRDHKDAHPDFRDLAHCMRELRDKSNPRLVKEGEWHTPYIADNELDGEDWERVCKVSVGRCARVCTLTHEGKRDPEADVAMHDKMFVGGHVSPYEHVARPMTEAELSLFRQRKLRWDPEHRCWIWVGASYRALVDQDEYSVLPAWKASRGDCLRRAHKEGEFTHFCGNYQGWVQLRKQIPFEEDIFGAEARASR